MTSPLPTANPSNPSLFSSSSLLIDRCLSSPSLPSAHAIHARLLKLALCNHTFLANRLLLLYSRIAPLLSVQRAFNHIPHKNIFSWNTLLAAFSNAGLMADARKVFGRMPHRDAVSWNSLVSGHAAVGLLDDAFTALYAMREAGVRGNAHTFSISASFIFFPLHAKEVHGSAVRCHFDSSSVVVGNSLIKMYGRAGVVDYACAVFRRLENPDSISWNSMISVFGNSGHGCLAFGFFRRMWKSGFCPDEFSISAVISVCANLEDMVKGEQLLGRCFKVGFISNSIVCSAVIDMYSQCGRLSDSLRFLEEKERWDSATLDSMASAYVRNGHVHDALNLFVMAVRRGVRPTDFTFTIVLSSCSCLGLSEQGLQIHCSIHKLGMEMDAIISTALIDVYMKSGSVNSAIKLFSAMVFKDLICWNTMILGLAQNGQTAESLRRFEQLLESGIKPDRTTILGVLSACSLGGAVCEGLRILSSMEEEYGIKCGFEHYVCAVEMMGRAGRLKEAMQIIETMPCQSELSIFESLLEACILHGNLSFAEMVAERMMTMFQPRSSLPYLVLGRMYGRRCMWESMAWILRIMKDRGVKRGRECSWIGIKNQIYAFSEDELLHHGGEFMYSVLRLLDWEIVKEGHVCEGFEDDEEEKMTIV